MTPQKPFEHPDGIYFDLDEDAYHADPALGSTNVKALLMAPEEYWGQSWMNPLYEQKQTPATVKGSAYHKFILEGQAAYEAAYAIEPDQALYGDALVTVADIDRVLKLRELTQTGKKGEKIQRLRDDGYEGTIWDDIVHQFKQENDGLVHIPPAMDQEIRYMARFITSNPYLSEAFKGGFPEVSVFWRIGDVRCKARIDYLKSHLAVDLKTYANQYKLRAEFAVEKNAANNRHDLQAAWYGNALEHAQDFARDGLLFGDNLPSAEWLEQFTAPVSLDLFYVYQQTGGVPMARARRWNPQMETLKTAQQEAAWSIKIFRSCLEEFGEEMPWIRAEAPTDYSDEPFAFIRR